MAKIINRSSHDLEVFGMDSGALKRWILPTAQQGTTLATAATFDCQALRAPDGSSIDVFGSEDWWHVLTAEAYAYDFGSSNVSLHCVPLNPGQPGYQKFDSSTITIPVDNSLLLTQPGPLGPRDGELDSPHPLFGKFVRTDNYISVRINPCRSDSVSEAELDAQLAIWKPKIEQVWNSAPKSSSGTKFVFECDWVNASEHYKITVYNTIPRALMFMWSLDMDDRTDPTGGPSVDNLITCAHEFGHFLGLTDGYVRDGELPWLIDLIKTKLKGKRLTFYSPLTYIAALMFSNKERAEDREKRECTGDIDMMTRQTRFKNGKPVPNPNIPPGHIDVIDRVGTSDYKTQDLCWRSELFE